MIIIGKLALVAAAIISLYSSISLASWLGDRRRHPYHSIYGAAIATFGAVTLATLVLVLAFIGNDYSLDYVAKYSSPDMPVYLKAAALWAGQAGSMLFWLFLLSGFTALIAYRRLKDPDVLTNHALLVLNVVELFFLAILILVDSSNPFLQAMNPNPAGLNPLLMHWAMVLHPPTLFIGYAGFTVPFAYALAALIAKDPSTEWVNRAHRWTLFAWLFLSVGIILGALWAYVVLGWGGYWGWDPVENASLVPWLTGVALMHSFTAYRRRGNLKIWTASLAATTFVLCIVATFITRSGVIKSVHAFEVNPVLTALFGFFMVGTIAASVYLLYTSRDLFAQRDEFESLASKHFTYYLNNVVMAAFAGIILFATAILPIFGLSWNADNYNVIARPLGILYLLLLIACPLFGWVKTEASTFLKRLIVPGAIAIASAIPIWFIWSPGKPWDPDKILLSVVNSKPVGFAGQLLSVFLAVSVIELFIVGAQIKAKNRGIGFLSALASIFRYNRSTAGGYLAHLGVAVAMFGVVASTMYVKEGTDNFTVNKPGRAVIAIGDYSLTYKRIEQRDEGSAISTRAYFDVFKRGRKLGEIAPKIAYFKLQQTSTRQVAIVGGSAIFNPNDLKLRGGGGFNRYNPFEDLFVSLDVDWNDQSNLSVEVKVNPLISFVWAGAFILMFGTALAYWPKRALEVPVAERAGRRRRAEVPAEA